MTQNPTNVLIDGFILLLALIFLSFLSKFPFTTVVAIPF